MPISGLKNYELKGIEAKTSIVLRIYTYVKNNEIKEE